jgi:hypothetical protein
MERSRLGVSLSDNNIAAPDFGIARHHPQFECCLVDET